MMLNVNGKIAEAIPQTTDHDDRLKDSIREEIDHGITKQLEETGITTRRSDIDNSELTNHPMADIHMAEERLEQSRAQLEET